MPLPLFVDTDIGLGTPRAEIDDGAALRVLLRSPEVEVCGLGTVSGNVSISAATHNARRLLDYEGRASIPVGRGAASALVDDRSWFDEWQAGYGSTPLWPGGEDLPAAANLLIEMVTARPGEITILALGPLTNLALAARLAPGIVPLVREVVAMGGLVIPDPPIAEFNIHCDPEAAAIVLSAGWPVRLVGIDVTQPVQFSRAEFAALPEASPLLLLLKQQAQGWIDRVEAQGWADGGCALHDAVAAAVLLDDTLCGYVETGVAVELRDPDRRGVTRACPQGHPARVAADIDVKRCHDFIWDRLTQ